jgi:hypothetical protein
MILEWLEYLATPMSPAVRDLRYAHELIAIGARHRRCRAAWAGHLARSRRAIITSIGRTRQRRTAIVIGSGRLLDVPLAELAYAFERVILVDVLHPLPMKWIARRHPNVELLTTDITGTIETLHASRAAILPPPQPFARLFAPDVDLVVSLNVVSQIGVLPVEWIEAQRGPQAADAAAAYAATLTRAHLDDLMRCTASVCMIADIEWQHVDRQGTEIERHSSVYDVAVPHIDEEWIWTMAPIPERDPNYSHLRRVIVSYDPGK